MTRRHTLAHEVDSLTASANSASAAAVQSGPIDLAAASIAGQVGYVQTETKRVALNCQSPCPRDPLPAYPLDDLVPCRGSGYR